MQRLPRLGVPELFLGLLSLAVAVVLTAHVIANTIHDARHVHDTISVTGSGRVPISANLVKWSLSVKDEEASAALAAGRLRADAARVRRFLRRAGIPADALSSAVVTSDVLVTRLPHHRQLTRYRVAQQLDVRTDQIDIVEAASTRLGELIERGIDVSATPLQYISTELTKARLDALQKATEETHRRAEIIVKGLGGKLGPMRSSSLGVSQITPRDSTEISDYGINDTSSRDKDVTAVVTATFAVKR